MNFYLKFISQVALVRAPIAALPALAFFLLGGKVKAISQAPLFWSRLSFSIFAQYCNVILSFPFFFLLAKERKNWGKNDVRKLEQRINYSKSSFTFSTSKSAHFVSSASGPANPMGQRRKSPPTTTDFLPSQKQNMFHQKSLCRVF